MCVRVCVCVGSNFFKRIIALLTQWLHRQRLPYCDFSVHISGPIHPMPAARLERAGLGLKTHNGNRCSFARAVRLNIASTAGDTYRGNFAKGPEVCMQIVLIDPWRLP